MPLAAKKKKTFFENIVEIIILLAIVFLIRTWGFGLYQVPTGSMEVSMLVGERFFADKFSYLFREPQRGEIIAFNEPPAFYNYSKNPFLYQFQKYVYGPSNWTKRVIGAPGDTVKGTIENGKAVIYVNDKKLEEQYLNPYPIIHVWSEDIHTIKEKINNEFQPLLWRGVDKKAIENMMEDALRSYAHPKSYDPSKSFDQQPFYRINPSRIMRGPGGSLNLIAQDVPQPSQYDRSNQKENYWDGSDEFFVKLGPDEYWAMGDNRKGSKDSRVFGPIKRDSIHGRILFRIWSMDSDDAWWILDLIKHPIDFWSRVRWKRFFQWIY